MMAAMAKILFRNRMNYSRWLVIGTIIALGVLSLSLFTGEVGPLFAVMGGGWLVVLAFIAIVIQLAGGRQVAAVAGWAPDAGDGVEWTDGLRPAARAGHCRDFELALAQPGLKQPAARAQARNDGV